MSAESDAALLRRFEPVLRFTRGEQFFPIDVDTYVRLCSLWTKRPEQDAVCVVPQGELTLPLLVQPHPDVFGAVQFLKLIDPLSVPELTKYYLERMRSRKDPMDVFRPGRGRLARVGYLSRLVDAVFTISLIARGRVPGDAAIAARILYKRIIVEQERHSYYGRVIRQNGWIVLQYWFFYMFDDWRSSFYGANDHEADWEMICVYLSETETGEINPEWAAFAAHDQTGDDIRRRWDDPELEKIGEHPVVYVGAGSHASYFRPGEYLSEVILPFLSPFVRVADKIQRFWHEKLRQYAGETPQAEPSETRHIFRVAFVDYARGDGLAIGPGQEREWSPPSLLSPPPAWVVSYRGLWGYFADDPFEGEDAPAGPMYDRDGSVRAKWYDPAGWCGLDKVPPLREAMETILRRQVEVVERQSALTDTVEKKSRALLELGVEAASLRGQPQLRELYDIQRERISALAEEVNELRAQLATDQTLMESMEHYVRRLKSGEREPVRSHILRPNVPASESDLRSSWWAEIWAALSVGLMLIAFVIIMLFARQYLIHWLVIIVSLFVVIEAYFHRQFTRLVSSVTIVLAVIAMFVLLYEFFLLIVILAVLVAAFHILWTNLRELSA